MPPKKAKKGGGAKDKKKKGKQDAPKKIAIDKTFGMKNKNKSKRVQKKIRDIEINNTMAGKSRKDYQAEEKKRKAKADAMKRKAAKKKELDDMHKNMPKIKPQILAPGTDPKSVLCAFFMKGMCKKGKKCKFSHDEKMGRKGAKMNIYADKKDDDMSKWSQDELEQSIAKRFGVAKVRACMPGVFVYSLWIHAWMDGWMMYWREREAEWTMKVRCNECSECTWVCSWIPMRHVHVHTLTPHSYHSPRTHRSRRVSWCASTSSRPLRRRSMDGSGSALTESHGTCRSGIPAFVL